MLVGVNALQLSNGLGNGMLSKLAADWWLSNPPGREFQVPGKGIIKDTLAYLHANCSVCHVEAGGGNAQIDLEFTTPRSRMKMLDVKPVHHTFGLADARLISPGHPERSVLYHRIATRGTGQMPPLATHEVDRRAADLIAEWIRSLKD